MRIEDIERQLLELPPNEKARLLHELVHSLDSASAMEIEAIWLDEAERRDRDMDQAGDAGLDGAAALRRIRQRLSEV
ncbi:MAG: addiction module protein [Thermoanaerobaculia bacterium]